MMNIKFSSHAEYTASTCSKEKMKKIAFFTFSIFIVISSGIPITAQAGLEEKVDEIVTKIGNVNTKVNDLPGAIQEKLGISLDAELIEKAKEAVIEVAEVVKALNTDIATFGDGSPGTACYDFKESLKSMFTSFGELSNSISTIGLPNPPAVNFGDIDLFDDIPCKALVAPSFAFEKTPLSEIKDKLIEVSASLQELLPLFIVPAQNISFDAQSSDDPLNEFVYPAHCTEVVIRRDEITNAGLVIKGGSFFLQGVAAAMDTEVFTGGGDINKLRPKAEEVDAGIHGYAHITLKRQKGRHKIAKGIEVLAKTLDSIQSTASRIKHGCINTHNQFLIHAQQEKILDLLGGQEEIIRLLLTPNGKRESDFCHGEICNSQSWKRTN